MSKNIFGIWSSMLTVCLMLAACYGKKTEHESDDVHQDSLVVAVVDSTLYGVAGEHGMSTFCLITDVGDTLLMSKTSDNGQYGIVYGGIHEGDRYAVIPTDDCEAFSEAINLTLLSRFLTRYTISNGRIVLFGHERSDTVDVCGLTVDSLVVSYSDGARRVFLPLH